MRQIITKKIYAGVFSTYDPDKKSWAVALVHKTENGVGKELYDLLFKLQEKEYRDAKNTTDIDAILKKRFTSYSFIFRAFG